MTLRVTLEIIPYGDESNPRRKVIRTFDIGNISYYPSEVCDYKVWVDGEEFGIIKDHNRADGAERLVSRVLDLYLYYNKEDTDDVGRSGDT